MKLGSKKPTEPIGADWPPPRPMREMRLADVTVGADKRPLIGTPLGRREMTLQDGVARETFKIGKLIGWHDKDKTQPKLQYPDGTREVLFSMSETNWKTL